MTPRVTRLDNGLRVVTQDMPHLHSVSLGVWVGVGARDERPEEHGICHLLEHMAFKGTNSRSAREIAEEIEQVGGDMNAATGLEMTAYYVRVLRDDVELGLEVLSDIVQNSTFLSDELEMEKEVILQEIAGIDDVPDEIAYDLLLDAAYPEQSVGRPVIGTPESVKSIGRSELTAHLSNRYSADSMVIAAAGAVDHNAFVDHVKSMFAGLKSGRSTADSSAKFVGGTRASKRGFEQCHLVVGFPGPSYRDDNFMLSQVFSGLLGGGMSSRLFQEVRENRGLCYSIYSSAWGLRDGGMFGIHAATGREMVSELAEVVALELRKCASGELTDKEVQRAKTQLKAGLLMSLESSSVRAEQMARQLLSVDRLISADELIARIDEVSSDGLCQFASRLLEFGQPAIAVVGAGGRSQKLAEQTSELFAA